MTRTVDLAPMLAKLSGVHIRGGTGTAFRLRPQPAYRRSGPSGDGAARTLSGRSSSAVTGKPTGTPTSDLLRRYHEHGCRYGMGWAGCCGTCGPHHRVEHGYLPGDAPA